jgi:hypothetical protein
VSARFLPDPVNVGQSAARQTIEQYLKLVDWASLLANKGPQENDEPSEAILLEELEDIKHTMSQGTPLSWLIETLTEELWNEEQFQGGDTSIHLLPGLQTV